MWRSRPIFISSTFQDMQAERDYLRTRVFPELEERLRARRHNLEWVDLRAGVATGAQQHEHLRELHVLKVCLEEVRRCRPFLIILLGDRYGWVPTEERIKAAAEEARQGFSAEVAGRSVTDLEIDFGVLSDPEQQPRSMFYFRDPLPYPEMHPEIAALYSDACAPDQPAAAERVKRLGALRHRIEQTLPKRVRHYSVRWDPAQQRVTGLEPWGRLVLEDIWSELEAETRSSASELDIPWQQVERYALEDFANDRARDFAGRQKLVDHLIDVATAAKSKEAGRGVCVTGDPGTGKSALFGELYGRLKEMGVFLLAHSAAASVRSPSVNSMLRRWIGDLAQALGIEPLLPENANSEKIDAVFADLLGRMAAQRRVVVLIDALDQFEATSRGRFATWLPQIWPANVQIIATANAGETSKALIEHGGIEVSVLPPLDAAEARDIVESICRRYHRTFEADVIAALLAKAGPDGAATGNPLWLVLAVEELNLLDADDFARAQRSYSGEPGERLRALMLDIIASLPADIPGLYVHTFGRAEEIFGAGLVRGFLGLIAVSRSGWRETDFRMLLPRLDDEPWDGLRFAQLRRLFRGQLRRRGALSQWDFNHAQMGTAVRGRLAVLGIAEQNIHGIVADHLLSCPTDDPLHVSETMVHLVASEEFERAAQYYAGTSFGGAEEQGATRALADAVLAPKTGTAAEAARRICRLLEIADSAVCGPVVERFLLGVYVAAGDSAPLDVRLVLANATKQTLERLLRSDPENASLQRDLSVSCEMLGDVQVAQANLTGALQSYRECVVVREQLVKTDPTNAQGQRDISVIAYQRVGDVQVAQGDLFGALKSYSDALTVAQRLADSDPFSQPEVFSSWIKLGEVHQSLGENDVAHKCYSRKSRDYRAAGQIRSE